MSVINYRTLGLNTDVAFKPACVCATEGNHSLSGLSDIDGVTLADGDRVLVKSQSSSVDNGIYNASPNSWSRAKDFNGPRDIIKGSLVFVLSGTVNAKSIFYVSSTAYPIQIGTDAITFVEHDLQGLYYTESEHISTSAGAADAGKPIVLDSAGTVDASMINDGDIDHTAITNIGTNTHVQIDAHIADGDIHLTTADIDAKDAAILASSQGYADSGDSATLASANAYADAQDAAHVSATDPHSQYSLVDGSRAFTGVVGGVDPTANAHLATKSYVDTQDSAHVAASDPHNQYLLIDGTRAMTGTLNSRDIIPTADDTYNLGSTSNAFNRSFTRQIVNVAGAGTQSIQAASKGGFMSGFQGGGGTVTHSLNGGGYQAVAVVGNCYAVTGGTALLQATRGGAMAFANSFTFGSGGTSTTSSQGYASFIAGYSYARNTGYARLLATKSASLVFGYAWARGTLSTSLVQSSGRGSFAAGMSRADASTGFSSDIIAGGSGSFAQGYAKGVTHSAKINASAAGTFAQGYARGANFRADILATGRGAFAQGYAKSGLGGVDTNITASGLGSFAQGYALNTTIAATAINAVQFGAGTNSTANSLQVGTGVQLHGDTGNGRFDGDVGIGQSTPTARLHIAAGTATANTAPLKFTTGTLLATPEDGVMEYVGGHLYFTNGSRHTLIRGDGVKTSTTTVTNTVTETTSYSYTFPANSLHADERIVFDMGGAYSNATASDDFTIKFKLGGATIATVSRTGGNVTDQGWKGLFEMTIRTIGATGTYVHSSYYDDTVTTQRNSDIVAHAVDTTASNLFEVTVTWAAAKAGNTFSCTQADLQFRH